MNLSNIFFSKKCIFCHKSGDYICKECLNSFNKYKINGNYRKNIIIGYYYRDSLREKFLSYKFNNKKSYARAFAVLLDEIYVDFNEYDIISYIPLSKKRMFERGFNQCELIIKPICKKYNKKSKNILSRKNTQKQSSLSGEERKENISGAFSLIENIENKKVLIFDDIYTTGSTSNEAILEIKKGNPMSVTVLTLFKS